MYKLRTNMEKSDTQPDLTILISLVQYQLCLYFFLIFQKQWRYNFQLFPLTVINYKIPLTYFVIPFYAKAVSRYWVHRPVIFTFGHISRKISKKKGEIQVSEEETKNIKKLKCKKIYTYGFIFKCPDTFIQITLKA